MTEADIEVARLREENARLKAAQNSRVPGIVRLSVSTKGCVSLHGLQAWPVTLYRKQWLYILDHMGDEIRAFIETHKRDLRDKE